MQPDSIIPDQTNPQSWNRFSYVTNRPINFNDPNGHCAPLCALPFFGGIVEAIVAAGAAIGAALASPVVLTVVAVVAVAVIIYGLVKIHQNLEQKQALKNAQNYADMVGQVTNQSWGGDPNLPKNCKTYKRVCTAIGVGVIAGSATICVLSEGCGKDRLIEEPPPTKITIPNATSTPCYSVSCPEYYYIDPQSDDAPATSTSTSTSTATSTSTSIPTPTPPSTPGNPRRYIPY